MELHRFTMILIFRTHNLQPGLSPPIKSRYVAPQAIILLRKTDWRGSTARKCQKTEPYWITATSLMSCMKKMRICEATGVRFLDLIPSSYLFGDAAASLRRKPLAGVALRSVRLHATNPQTRLSPFGFSCCQRTTNWTKSRQHRHSTSRWLRSWAVRRSVDWNPTFMTEVIYTFIRNWCSKKVRK